MRCRLVAGVLCISDAEAMVGELHDLIGHEFLVHGAAWGDLPFVVPIGDKLQRHDLRARHRDAAPARRVAIRGHLRVSALVHDGDLLAIIVVAVHGDQPFAAEVGHGCVLCCVCVLTGYEDEGRERGM
eukprot:5471381-Prymnesium_polylepis.1